jgi:hypothetical protein
MAQPIDAQQPDTNSAWIISRSDAPFREGHYGGRMAAQLKKEGAVAGGSLGLSFARPCLTPDGAANENSRGSAALNGIALGLSAVAATLATPAHAYYLDCLRGAPCPGFNAPSPRYYVPPPRYSEPTPTMLRADDTMVHRPTILRASDTTTTTRSSSRLAG